MIRLSICIATFNRGNYIGQTLASIVPQLSDEVEVVVYDGASADDTAAVVGRFVEKHRQVRYVRAPTNSGVDADFDHAVTAATGEHVWLFTDDDILIENAVQKVLAVLATKDPDVLVVNAEVRDLHLDRRFEPSRLQFSEDRCYLADEMDSFMADAGDALTFIGCAVIRRSLWLERDRQSYFGSLFVHVGVIFQRPVERAMIVATPLVAIRMGNAMWSRRAFEIWMFKWPALIWGFDGYSDAAKARVVAREPWRSLLNVLTYRGYGSFTREEYRALPLHRLSTITRWSIGLMLATPGSIVHVLILLKSALGRTRNSSVTYNLLVASRNSNWLSRLIGRCMGYSLKSRQTS